MNYEKQMLDIFDRVGDPDEFIILLDHVRRIAIRQKRMKCKHEFISSQICGDGDYCVRCGAWRPDSKML